jgi:hypothetical protein
VYVSIFNLPKWYTYVQFFVEAKRGFYLDVCILGKLRELFMCVCMEDFFKKFFLLFPLPFTLLLVQNCVELDYLS